MFTGVDPETAKRMPGECKVAPNPQPKYIAVAIAQ